MLAVQLGIKVESSIKG